MTRTEAPLIVVAVYIVVLALLMLVGPQGVRASGCSMTGTLVDAQGTPSVNLELRGFAPDEAITLTTMRPDNTTFVDSNIRADPNGNTGVLAPILLPGTYLYEARSGTCVASFSVSVGAAENPSPAGRALTPVPTLPATDTE